MAGIPVGLDFGAVMAVAVAQEADLELLSDTLPEFEAALLAGMSGEPTDIDEEMND